MHVYMYSSVQAELNTERKVREGAEVALVQRTEQLEEVSIQVDRYVC